MWWDELSDENRRAYVLLKTYEELRAKTGFFRLWAEDGPEVLATRTFRVGVITARWLTEEGLKIGFKQVNWRGYLEFLFEHAISPPSIPQLRNSVMLRRYWKTWVRRERVIPPRSTFEVRELYKRTLTPLGRRLYGV